MKIVVDARFYGTEHTGLGRYTMSVLEYLPQYLKDHEVYLLLNKKYARRLKFPKNVKKIICDIPHYTLAEQLSLPRLVDSLHADLYYSLHFNVPLRLKTPFIVTIHDMIKSHFASLETTTRNFLVFKIKRLAYNLVMEHSVQGSAGIIVPTNTVKNDILALYPTRPEKIRVVYESTTFSKDLKFENLKLDIPTNYLLYVGNAYPHKNLPNLMEALGKLKNLNLVIVSKTNSFLNNVIKNAPSSVVNRLTVLQQVSDQELVFLYKKAKAIVAPALMEGFGLPGLESLKLGTPVVASNIPVFREVYGDSAVYFDPHNPSSIAKGIEKAVALKSKKKYIWKHTWEEAASTIAEVMNEYSHNIR